MECKLQLSSVVFRDIRLNNIIIQIESSSKVIGDLEIKISRCLIKWLFLKIHSKENNVFKIIIQSEELLKQK